MCPLIYIYAIFFKQQWGDDDATTKMKITQLIAEKTVVRAKLLALNKGGGVVFAEGLRCFLPGSCFTEDGKYLSDMPLGSVYSHTHIYIYT
jgi:hypothetical protein